VIVRVAVPSVSLLLKSYYNKLSGRFLCSILASVQIRSVVDAAERARAAKPEQFVDLSIVRELDESKFIDGLYK
jgi:hypothetical protein